MKPSVVFLVGLVLCACSNRRVQEHTITPKNATLSNSAESGSNFNEYLQTLDEISLPFLYSSNGVLPELSNNYNKERFEKYKYTWAVQPLGILFKTKQYIALVDCSIGDTGYGIFITTFNKQGIKIDSLAPYSKSGVDIGYEATEYLQVTSNKQISVIDSTKRWTLSKNESDVVEGTMKLTVDTAKYFIDELGRFKKI